MHIAVDGWSLVERPWSVAALHLQEWLAALQRAGPALRFTVLYPAGPPPQLPAWAAAQQVAVPATEWGRLRYEQRWLPRAAGELGADWLFLPNGAAPLASPIPGVVLIGERTPERHRSAARRVRESLGRAGAGGTARRLRYADLPADGRGRALIDPVSPLLGDPFRPLSGGSAAAHDRWGLEPGYVLSCSVTAAVLGPLLAAWTWVEGSVGETVPLVLSACEPAVHELARQQAAAVGVQDALRMVTSDQVAELAELFRGAAAYLYLAAEPTGQPLRWALGSGVPIVGVDSPSAAAILGQAGYLVPPGDARALGAACLTVLVEDAVAADLRQKGLLRAADWRGPEAMRSWLRVFYEGLQ